MTTLDTKKLLINAQEKLAQDCLFVITHVVDQYVPDGMGDSIVFYDLDDMEYTTLEEEFASLSKQEKEYLAKTNECGILLETGIEFNDDGEPEITDPYAFRDYMVNIKNKEAYEYEKRRELAEFTVFLTKEEADEHLIKNRHHYEENPQVTPIAMSKGLKELNNAIQTINWRRTKIARLKPE